MVAEGLEGGCPNAARQCKLGWLGVDLLCSGPRAEHAKDSCTVHGARQQQAHLAWCHMQAAASLACRRQSAYYGDALRGMECANAK